ncbi:MAG: adenylate/guanylate cyclase domain-containing protein [Ginsengibacter sp.]
MPVLRQLTAIMFADIAGYTAMMQEDEERAIMLRHKFRDQLVKEVSNHFGRILDLRGDGAMCSFTSSIEAVRSALSLQQEMLLDPSVPVRIGLHTGDVAIDGDEIYGDGVNIASRIESFSIPGSILISGRVYDDIRNQRDIQSASLGKFSLKNVKEEIEIFAVTNHGINVPDKKTLEGKGEKAIEKRTRKSVAVLPFINMSNDPDQEYFSDGLTEELISNLSKLKDMRVISRTTSMQYKATTKGMKIIGSETGANYIIEGSVRKNGNAIRITSQLIDASQDVHLWSDTFNGTIDDIFDMQEMVSSKIVEAFRLQLTHEEQKKLLKRYTENTEAYQLYLQGRYFWKQRNATGLTSAARHFQRALEKDPDYALAWAGLADTYSLMGEFTNISRRDLFPKQMAAVNRALQIDNKLGEAHISLAISLMLNEWDWHNSEKEFKLGIELNPNYATAHHWYAEWLMFMGRMEESFTEINIAVDLDPISQGIMKDKGIYYYYNREYSKAINMAMVTLELDPNFAPARRLLSLGYQGLGQMDESISENEKWRQLTGNKIKSDVALAQILASAGRKEETINLLTTIINSNVLGGNDYRGMALIYSSLDDKDTAFSWLQKSIDQHEESLCSLKIDPKIDPLRGDPRFNGLLKKIGLA